MTLRLTWHVALSAALLITSCQRTKAPPQHDIKASQLPRIRITSKMHALYTYLDKQTQRFATAQKVDSIPQLSRGWVRVVDLKQTAAKRKDLDLVYVADLRTSDKRGRYPYIVMPRQAFEQAARERQGGASDQPKHSIKTRAKSSSVILYATSWCPACKKARQWLAERNIPFVEKDIEKNPNAANELMQKAKRAGISTSGVPVLDVNGVLVQGFDAQRISTLLAKKPS